MARQKAPTLLSRGLRWLGEEILRRPTTSDASVSLRRRERQKTEENEIYEGFRLAIRRSTSLQAGAYFRTKVSMNGVIANSAGITRKHPDLLPQVRVLFLLLGHRIRTWNSASVSGAPCYPCGCTSVSQYLHAIARARIVLPQCGQTLVAVPSGRSVASEATTRARWRSHTKWTSPITT